MNIYDFNMIDTIIYVDIQDEYVDMQLIKAEHCL